MADFLETNLKKLAGIQRKHTRTLAVLVILVTVILGIGLIYLIINSYIRKEMPTEMLYSNSMTRYLTSSRG